MKRIKINWSGMAGFGPTAWDRDNKSLNMHTPHEGVHHHAEHVPEGKNGDDTKKRSE